MGKDKNSILLNTAKNTANPGAIIHNRADSDRMIALVGNPNVGKSSVFNGLTGLRQHTGNWPGKTVECAEGFYDYKNTRHVIVDLPGCYSLMAHSGEEEVARDFICFGGAEAIVAVCDATCLQRGLNLVLQTLEITKNVVVCINLMDEAKKKGIKIDLDKISQKLGVPVIGASARVRDGLDDLMAALADVNRISAGSCFETRYPEYIESAVKDIIAALGEMGGHHISGMWLSLMLLQSGFGVPDFIPPNIKIWLLQNRRLLGTLETIKKEFSIRGITERQIKDDIVSSIVRSAEGICSDTVIFENADYKSSDSRIDRILTGKLTSFPLMIMALFFIFWLTITGANYPSKLLGDVLFLAGDQLLAFFTWLGAPQIITDMLILGVYRALASVVSVMLPPMAIFFPLFTLLEDLGFLPRIAFNLDKCFKKCHACGKQALTMCMA